MKYERWSYVRDNYVDEKTIRIEEDCDKLKLYEYFSTLRWKWCYAIVYDDSMLRECEEMPYDEWEIAKEMLLLLSN